LRRIAYHSELAQADLSRLKFLDEAGSHLAMTRLYGRGEKGHRVVEAVPKDYGENLSMLASLSVTGIEAPMTINGAVDSIVFTVYVEEVLCPSLKAGDIVIMDNLSVHKVKGISELIAGCGAKLIYLPPYSPDLNPIEKCWSKIKTYLRRAKARTRAALEQAFQEALLLITPEDALGWFKSCGYAIH
jgi:transposase